MDSTRTTGAQDFDVLILGGGNAGLSLAAYLRRTAAELSVAVVSPSRTHLYRPLLSYVGGGMCRPHRTRRPQQARIPDGVSWIRDEVSQLTPGQEAPHTVVTAGGQRLQATDVVVCPGTTIDWDAIAGSEQACRSPHASSNYSPELAPGTWRMLRDLDGGDAVFLVSNRNTPCPGVGLKPLFLAADRWRRAGSLPRITVVLEDDAPTGLPKADAAILDQLRQLEATVHAGARIERIDADRRTVAITTREGQQVLLPYDAMHLAPPHRGHQWVVDSGITDDDSTLVDTDPRTLEHHRIAGLWALGDAADLDTPSSGGGLRHQVPVVAHNILARRRGARYRSYNGYTVAPVPLTRSRLLLAERDRTGAEVRTVPVVSLAVPRRVLLWFDLRLQPVIYWHRLLRGKGLPKQ